MRTSRGYRAGSRIHSLLSLVLVTLVLTACGPFSDDDDAEPTSTDSAIAQPTDPTDETSEPETEPAEATGTEAVTEESTEAPESTEAQEGAATPEVATPEEPRSPFNFDLLATPTAEVEDEAATPVNTSLEETADDQPQPTAAVFQGSDGTSGATPISVPRSQTGSTPEADAPAPGGTPGLAVFEETREPTTIDLAAIDPVSVEGCSPDNVPVLIDGEASFVTNSTVNFRIGPGAECDAIGNGPLSAGIPVQVTSAPVENGVDEYVWVQIRVNDITGWVILESLDAA